MAKARKLGKGLDALLGSDDGGQEEYISISMIIPNAWQPRRAFDQEALEALSESIKEHGVVQPIIVRPQGNRYELIAGERRLRASQMAGLLDIPAIIRDYTDKETAEIALIENLQREDLNPLEEGLAYERMMNEYEVTQDGMAKMIGKSRSYVANILRLLELPDEVKELIKAKKLSAGQARPLLGLKKKTDMVLLARMIVEKDFSVRKIEDLIRKMKGTIRVPKEDKSGAYLRSIEEELLVTLGSKVRIKVGKGKNSHRGTIAISFTSDKEFERLMGFFKKEGKA